MKKMMASLLSWNIFATKQLPGNPHVLAFYCVHGYHQLVLLSKSPAVAGWNCCCVLCLDLFLNKWPALGIYIGIIRKITIRFLSVSVIAILLLISFTFTFYMAFYEPDLPVSYNLSMVLFSMQEKIIIIIMCDLRRYLLEYDVIVPLILCCFYMERMS